MVYGPCSPLIKDNDYKPDCQLDVVGMTRFLLLTVQYLVSDLDTPGRIKRPIRGRGCYSMLTVHRTVVTVHRVQLPMQLKIETLG